MRPAKSSASFATTRGCGAGSGETPIVAEIAQLLSAAATRLGPIEKAPPAPSPRPVPPSAAGSLVATGIFAALGLVGIALAIGSAFSGPMEALLLRFAGGATAALFFTLAFIAWFMRNRRARLYRTGNPALARVTRSEPVNHYWYGHQYLRVTYELDNDSGQRFISSAKAVNAPSVGEETWVIYDPKDPNRTVLA